MSAADYYILTISNLTPDEADIVSALSFDEGAQGTEEILQFEQKNREYEPVTLAKERTQIKIYFYKTPPVEFLERLQANYPNITLEITGETNRDWLAEWKKSFRSFCLAGETWVVPSWCDAPTEAKKIIRIDPGMAFGTGTHETTRLAANFLNEYASHSQNCTLQTLLDVGTGTGILAIQAELLGFREVWANDIDPEARRVARENTDINKSQKVKIVDESLAQIEGKFDWVVANIIDGVLVLLQNDLKSHLNPKGHLLLTGILQERDDLFLSEFSFSGFRLIERKTLAEWVGYLLEKI
jgi:ribosomal protein L11 methyltransferase